MRQQTFENFVVGLSNQLAYSAALAAAGGEGRRYNPLFIHGRTGLGKTHLLRAVMHRMTDVNPDARIAYTSAADLLWPDDIACDVLLVDDVDGATRPAAQAELLRAFAHMHNRNRQIVLTSAIAPQDMGWLDERLASRLVWGLVADIQAPDLETRASIIRSNAALEGMALPDDVVLHVAQTLRSNARELEGAVIRLKEYTALKKCAPDLFLARGVVVGPRREVLTIEDVQRAVCQHFRLRVPDLIGKDRHKSIAFARHCAMFLCKQRLKYSYPEIGKAFDRDHSTVMSAVSSVAEQIERDPQVRFHIDAINTTLTAEDIAA